MMRKEEIISNLPYSHPFLFVDELLEIDQDGVYGNYTFRSDLPFYRGHFVDKPVTPGVILSECCAQIGLVCLGLYLLGNDVMSNAVISLAKSEMEYFTPVMPEETVFVRSEKVYFRFNKLKCKVSMRNSSNVLVCKGTISGMLNMQTDDKT